MSAWIWAVAGVAGFAGASFFFALAESSLFSLGRWRLQRLTGADASRVQLVQRLLEAPQDLLATLVFGNSMANAAAVGLALWVVLEGGGGTRELILTALGLFSLLVVGAEVVPKTLAVRAPERWSLRVAPLMWWVLRVTRPFWRVAQRLVAWLLRRLVPRSVQPTPGLTDAEYRELMEMAAQSGTLGESEKEMILRIMQLDQRTAKDVMRPRSQMACLRDDLSIEEMIAAARNHRHRRLPLYDESPDTIVGILNTRVLLLDPQVDLSEAIEFPSFVPESMNLLLLLKSLQRQQRGMAIVLDEYGGTAGLVTQTDILEALIGEMRREGEAQPFLMERLGEGRWRVNASTRIEDFRREFPSVPAVDEVETVGGLAVFAAERVPGVGESVVAGVLRLTITAGDDRRVRELLVEVVPRKGGR